MVLDRNDFEESKPLSTESLPLIGEMLPVAPVEVVCLHAGRRGAEVILGAAGRGQVVEVAGVLAHLKHK